MPLKDLLLCMQQRLPMGSRWGNTRCCGARLGRSIARLDPPVDSTASPTAMQIPVALEVAGAPYQIKMINLKENEQVRL